MKVFRETRQAIKDNPEAYDFGLDAAIDGKGIDDNPYVRDSSQWVAWRAGWLGVC